MALDWDAWIGQEEEPIGQVEDILPSAPPPTTEEMECFLPPTPPPVIDDLVASALQQNIDLENKIKAFTDDSLTLPAPKTLNDYPDKIVQDPVLIEGLFRKGRKGILTADSKAGKSFFAIELAISVAAGRPFLGRKCTKSKVCYFNYEIEEKEFMQRVKDVAKELKIPISDFIDDLKIVHMRGMSVPLSKMAGNIIAMLLTEYKNTKEPFSLIILDPIYKITAGDENSAESVGKFCNNLDKIALETGCAVFYTHHHAKGDQGGKKAMDRGSGSGVFARDPDLMIDLTALEIDGQTRAALMNNSICEFWKAKLNESVENWQAHCQPSDLKSSGALAVLYQTMVGLDPAKVTVMVLDAQRAFEEEISKVTAFRMEFVARSFETPAPQNVVFKYPIHKLDESGALVMAEPESHIAGMKKKATPEVKAQKMDVFVETVDALILSNPEGFTTYSDVAETLDVDVRTITRRLSACDGRYEVEKGNGRGIVSKIRFSAE